LGKPGYWTLANAFGLALAGNGPTPVTQFARHLPWANWVTGLCPMPLAGLGWKWPDQQPRLKHLPWTDWVLGLWPMPLASLGWKWPHSNNPVCWAFTLGKLGYWTLANALGWPCLEMAPFQ